MGIDYLLLLQQFRESTQDAFTPFMEYVSHISVNSFLLMVSACIYWAYSKKMGAFLLFNSAFGNVVNSTLKCTFCVYRPWILNSRVVPAGDAIRTATGYSFPSGHTQSAMANYGGLAYLFARNRRLGWCLLMCFMVLLTGFSRNYLGVHTPQDVAVAIVATFGVLVFDWYVLGWADRSKNNDCIVMGVSAMITVAFLCYIAFKPYPMDYVDGRLLVDPVRMQDDSWGAAGMFAGVALGWFVERRWVNFMIEGTVWNKVLRVVLGLVPLYLIRENIYPWLIDLCDIHTAKLMCTFVPFFFVSGLYPVCIKLVQLLTRTEGK